MGSALTVFRAVLDNFVGTALGEGKHAAIVTVAARIVLWAPALWFSFAVGQFHSSWKAQGPSLASQKLLGRLYGVATRRGTLPSAARGTLVLGNHPGLGDTLLFLSGLGHDHVKLVAKSNPFLEALPHLHDHLLLIDGPGGKNTTAVSRILGALRAGYTVLLYPAGVIEPDPAWTRVEQTPLKPWSRSVGILVEAGRREALDFDLQCVCASGVYPGRPRGRGRWANLSVVLGLSARRWSPTLVVGPALGSGQWGDKVQAINRAVEDQMLRLIAESRQP